MSKDGSLAMVLGAVVFVSSAAACGAANEGSAAFASDAAYIESDIPPANQPTPRAEVTATDGADAAQVQREYSAAAHGLRACPNDGRVPVRVRIKKEDGRTEIGFVDSVPALSSESRRCVLDAMSAVDVDDIPSGGSPSNRASGFTAIVLLSW